MRLLLGLSILIASVAQGGDIEKDIDAVVKQGRGTPAGQAAWARLACATADVLPVILEGMNTRDTVAANWLRTAFDQVAERELKAGGKNIDSTKLLAFVKNP